MRESNRMLPFREGNHTCPQRHKYSEMVGTHHPVGARGIVVGRFWAVRGGETTPRYGCEHATVYARMAPVGFVIVFSDSDRVGRGEWSRVYDACMVVRVYLSGLRAPCMPRRCLRRLETRHPYHLGGVFWYGSSISIIIYLSLIRGISSVADGENARFIAVIYSCME